MRTQRALIPGGVLVAVALVIGLLVLLRAPAPAPAVTALADGGALAANPRFAPPPVLRAAPTTAATPADAGIAGG